MRFGHDFHRYQVPEWASSYIPYISLKGMVSTAVRAARHKKSQPDLKETLLCLERSIDEMSNFHHDKYQYLLKSEEEIRKEFGLTLESESFVEEPLDCCQLEELLGAIVEVRKDFQKLQWYFRVNTEAINRIYSKLNRYNESSSQLSQHRLKWLERKVDHDAQCARGSEILTTLTTKVLRSQALTGPRLMKSSAHLKTLHTQSIQHGVIPDFLRCIIMEDQSSELSAFLEKLSIDYRTKIEGFRELLYEMARISVTYGSEKSLNFFLSEAFPKFGVKLDSGFLIHMILHLGRSSTRQEYHEVGIDSLCGHKRNRNEAMTRCFLLTVQLLGQDKDALLAKDSIGRSCLHYTALYGLHSICQSILEPALRGDRAYAQRLILSVDSQGYTPLHYAVINNQAAITNMLLGALNPGIEMSQEGVISDLAVLLDELIFIAIRYQFEEISFLLGKRRSGCDTRFTEGETALYVAARTGNEEIVDFLIKTGWDKYINIPETARGWTPLFIACAQGHLAVTKLLLQAGAKQDIIDHTGWTAKEHAAFRGHLAVSELLNSWSTFNLPWSSPSLRMKPVCGAEADLLPDSSHIIINLGAIQRGDMTKALVLNSNLEKNYCSAGSLSLEVAVSEGSGARETVELPILNDMVNEPFHFPISDPEKVQLAFKLYRAQPVHTGERAHLGSGVALLSILGDCFGALRESLIRERTVPILGKDTLSVLGTVTFTFLIVRPMIPPNITTRATCTFTASSLQLVGHRGLGQNTAKRSYLQLGENTMESFRSAAQQGATYVEFDVQLTRDLVPVIYHDFSLSESGTDIPIHDLTVEQFMCASKLQLPKIDPTAGCPITQAQKSSQVGNNRTRSRSLTEENGSGTQEIRDRLKHTVDFQNKGFKPNTRGAFIQDLFTTLENVLTDLPDSVGLNVEIKYPRIHEAAEAGVSPIVIEINTFVDNILQQIFLHARNTQNVILSSFTPEVCILLAFKQKVYPVMFITNAGKPPVTDLEIRASSLQSAVHFAKRWSLSGIVFASETLISCPRLIGYVKQSGLACGSYGLLNNNPENAKAQAAAGIDILMADRVGLIAGALKEDGYL